MTAPAPDLLRLFIAIELPDEVRRALAQAVDVLRRDAPREAARWVRPEGAHLTLKFLGNIERADAGRIVDALRRACQDIAPYALQAEGLQAFHGGRGGPHEFRRGRESYPRSITVVFTGISAGASETGALAAGVETHVAPLGFPTEHRAFLPHLTLARVPRTAGRDAREALSRALAPYFWHPQYDGRPPALPAIPAFTVDAVALMRSQLHPSGARYEALAHVPLAGGGP